MEIRWAKGPAEATGQGSRTGFLPLVVLSLASAGLFFAGFLSLAHSLEVSVPCGRDHGCSSVAAHPASRFFGVPIAYAGAAAYLSMIFIIRSAAVTFRARIALLILAAAGTVVSGALLIYSKWVIQAACSWCIASGIAGSLRWRRAPGDHDAAGLRPAGGRAPPE
jgi:uncharacterized membrane protein